MSEAQKKLDGNTLSPERIRPRSGFEPSFGEGRYRFDRVAESPDLIKISLLEGIFLARPIAPDESPSNEGLRALLFFASTRGPYGETSDASVLPQVIPFAESVRASNENTKADASHQWTPQGLTNAILEATASSDMHQLREFILIAEDLDFSRSDSARLAPWLLDFAMRYRDSNNPEDGAAVWSAVRTGASLLGTDAIPFLIPLLEAGHAIETALVAMKMIGRIFETQPPSREDGQPELAVKVRQIAESLLNPYVIDISRPAALAQLAVYALAAMASSEILGVARVVRSIGAAWFTRSTSRKLAELRGIWSTSAAFAVEGPTRLLDSAIQTLAED